MSKTLDDIWESWDYHIKDDLARVDRKFYLAISEAMQFNIKPATAIRYFREKLDETIQEIAVERQAKTKGPKRHRLDE
ncbi:hypothetical protein [Paenibacillus sp. ACRRX]|uniref:hypothetical protein n=1 Tax=Paenibacillus sp. ACRRX TaxID=2918206 RepID=UPI001EF68201|nr:hypothetical protein [Paenibacillus sp. ACRRX]